MQNKEEIPVVLVTGSACRIGAAIVRKFVQSGWRAVIHYRHSRLQAEALFAELGGMAKGHLLLQKDLLEKNSAQELLAAAVSASRRLDCLVNNAAVYQRATMLETSENFFQQAYANNFLAPFRLMQEFRKLCRCGSIINLLDHRVSSVDAGGGAYLLAKKSLRDATEACALEWAPDVRVNAVAPGIVLPPPELKPETSMRRILQYVPMQKESGTEEVAKACLFLAESQTITGQTLYVDGGLHLHNGNLGEKNK